MDRRSCVCGGNGGIITILGAIDASNLLYCPLWLGSINEKIRVRAMESFSDGGQKNFVHPVPVVSDD